VVDKAKKAGSSSANYYYFCYTPSPTIQFSSSAQKRKELDFVKIIFEILVTKKVNKAIQPESQVSPQYSTLYYYYYPSASNTQGPLPQFSRLSQSVSF